jgi:hypothetical protein
VIGRKDLRSVTKISQGGLIQSARPTAQAARPIVVKREEEEEWGKKNRDNVCRHEPHHVYGPKNDGTNVIEFHTAAGEALAISVPAGETRVLKYFQQRMP